MLKLKPNCECCNVNLPPESDAARICSFECTFCKNCTEQNFKGLCPNCGGELVKRPIRPEAHLTKFPAADERFLNVKHAVFDNYARHSKT